MPWNQCVDCGRRFVGDSGDRVCHNCASDEGAPLPMWPFALIGALLLLLGAALGMLKGGE